MSALDECPDALDATSESSFSCGFPSGRVELIALSSREGRELARPLADCLTLDVLHSLRRLVWLGTDILDMATGVGLRGGEMTTEHWLTLATRLVLNDVDCDRTIALAIWSVSELDLHASIVAVVFLRTCVLDEDPGSAYSLVWLVFVNLETF